VDNKTQAQPNLSVIDGCQTDKVLSRGLGSMGRVQLVQTTSLEHHMPQEVGYGKLLKGGGSRSTVACWRRRRPILGRRNQTMTAGIK
jgi:hypothetical protein